ncbi:MAG: hypothetical protein VW395_03620, partial [Methylotenera sp.]
MHMQAHISTDATDDIITHIAEQGFCIVENFLDSVTVSSLAAKAINLKTKSELKPAGIGRENRALNAEIRGDSIYWLDAAQATAAE